MDNKLEKLTFDQILAIHLEIETDEEITFSEKRLKSNIEYLNQFEKLDLYATQLLCTMIWDDIFENNNIETAILSLDFFLRHNGYQLKFEDEASRKAIFAITDKIKNAKELKKDDLKEIQADLTNCFRKA